MDQLLQMARCENGFLVRIVGRGTMRESVSFTEMISKCLSEKKQSVVIDLGSCDYLDSTFLGCLVQLHTRFNKPMKRFAFHADGRHREQLFSKSCFDRLLHFLDSMPEPVGDFVDVEPKCLETREMGEHILHCHQQLVEMGGETAKRYRPIVERLAEELKKAKELKKAEEKP